MAKETHVHVEFYTEAVRDGKASNEAGREVFREEEFCKVMIVGDKENNLVIRAHEPFTMNRETGGMMTPAERWPDQYAAFQRREAQAVVGTPLNHLPFLGKAQVAELQYNGITTAEQLASLSEAAIAKGFGLRDLRTKAQVWLDDADKNAVAAKAALEADRAKAENDELRQKMAALEAKLAALDEPKRGPGRPRKEAEAA